MKLSQLFGKTTKNVSKNTSTVSHKLLTQAGFIRESVAGRYYFLPLGIRVNQKIIDIIREEMNKAGAQEILTPVLHPLELWKETNRDSSVGFELMIIKDRRGAKFALGGTAEEMVIDLVRKFQISYKDLPFNLYQFSQKFRDELRVRGGLLRAREFMMKDAYSFHIDEADFKKEYQIMKETYTTIFKKMGMETLIVESDNGYIGGDYCHEFVVESKEGESKFLMTPDGAYKAHEEVAKFDKENKNIDEELLEVKQVEAKRGKTMEDGVKLHKKPLWQQIKDVMFVDEQERFILAIIRGDFDVNETKLKNLIKANELRHAEEKEIREKLNSEPGFISPVGIKNNLVKNIKLVIVADDSLRTIKNAYGGANKKNQDLINVNIDRDYRADIEGDIALAKQGYLLKGQKLKEGRGIEVGNIFQLGYLYSKKMKNAIFINKNGQEQKYYMGCYGIGIGRTMATIVEKHHDERGIIWPESVAPYKIHLIVLGEDKIARDRAAELYKKLHISNRLEDEVLFDDREISAGAKFADADLIGCPYRIVISEKTLKEDSVELKKRDQKNVKLVKIDKIGKYLLSLNN